MIGVVNAEGDVGATAVLKTFDGVVTIAPDLFEGAGKRRKRLLGNAMEQFGLVLEVEIDGGRGVLDLLGDAAHRDVVVPFAHKKLASRINYLLS